MIRVIRQQVRNSHTHSRAILPTFPLFLAIITRLVFLPMRTSFFVLASVMLFEAAYGSASKTKSSEKAPNVPMAVAPNAGIAPWTMIGSDGFPRYHFNGELGPFHLDMTLIPRTPTRAYFDVTLTIPPETEGGKKKTVSTKCVNEKHDSNEYGDFLFGGKNACTAGFIAAVNAALGEQIVGPIIAAQYIEAEDKLLLIFIDTQVGIPRDGKVNKAQLDALVA